MQNRPDLSQIITQLALIDPVVAIELSALSDCLARAERREAATQAANRPMRIALIPVSGPLTPRGSFFGSSLNGIASQVTRAANDPDIGGIVLEIDSPGGTVSGTVEAASAVAVAAKIKPTVAIANTLAASAAYWIGSQASEFVMAPSADVGSIGAMIVHQDISGALDNFGVKVTMIRSEQSPNKNEAHPFGPLTDEARSFLQDRANEAGADFIKSVAAGRGISQTKVREDYGQGRVFGAREALSRGMVDRVATLDDVISGMAQRAARSRRRSALMFS